MSVPGHVIADRYRLVNLVGTGGMGVVWEAWDERLQRRVAVKQLRLPAGLDAHEAEVASQRAMREARITARLHHRNAIAVFDVVDDDGRPCLIMQFVPSMTLADILKDSGPLQPQEAARLGAEVASALAAAHQLGIVHRDVKPANVLVAEDGTALISDFGISQALGDASLTATGLVHGTPSYLSPEVARGEQATFASDVFGLGATLYTALEGAPPFGTDANSIALLHRVAAGNFEPPQRSGPLTPLLHRMLASDPGARPPMDVAARRLEELAAGGVAQPAGSSKAGEPTVLMPTVQVQSPTTAAEVETPRQPAAAAAGAQPSPTRARPAAGPSGASRPSEDDGSSPARSHRRRRMAWIGVLVAALAAAGIGAALLIPSLAGSDHPGAAAGAPATAGTTGSPSAGASKPDSPSAGASQPASPTSGSPASASPTAAPTSAPHTPKPNHSTPAGEPASHKSPKAGKSPTKEQLTNAITSYYALLPAGTDQAWPRMTEAYRADHAGGRKGYEQFWAPIDRVDTRNVTATPPDRVEATVTYHYNDGRTVVERTSYQLVEEGGTLKIAASQVLSSSTR